MKTMDHKYEKLPVVIEAFQLTKDVKVDDWPQWLRDAYHTHPTEPGALFIKRQNQTGRFAIKTLEGDMLVSFDDWVIKGVQGELYPCKPDIFKATYKKVTDDV
jgi:hypothetical protein